MDVTDEDDGAAAWHQIELENRRLQEEIPQCFAS
jgi:hypothetical protein